MAGYYTSFNGDILKINYVDPVFEAKSVLIPGLTTPMDVVVNGEQAYYFEIDGLTVDDGDAGRTLSLADSGATRVDITLKKSLAFGGYIPGVGIADVSEDIVGTKAAKSTNAIVLKENEIALGKMVAGGTESTNKTASTKATIYDNIVDDIATFTTTNGHSPVAIIVSPATKALLQKSEAFVRGNAEFSVNQAVIGEVGGLAVVDGIGMPSGTEYIITDGYGYLHPHALVGLELFGNIPGRVNTVALQGEWVYGSKVIKATRLLLKKSA